MTLSVARNPPPAGIFLNCEALLNNPLLSPVCSVVKCALEMKQYMHVATYVQKAEAIRGHDTAVGAGGLMTQLRCAQGLAHLANGKYLFAARIFINLPADVGNSVVACPRDVGTYAVLCALATMDRAEFASRVIEGPAFRELFSLAPKEIQAAAQDFHASRHGPALAGLASLRPVLCLDPLLADHLENLMSAVRGRALAFYTQPFSTLDLTAMAAAFGLDVE